jgi:hypothetical protein
VFAALAFGAMLSRASGQAVSGPPEPIGNWEQLSILAVPANPNHYVFEWNGFPGRTYFLQVSHDLKTWIYLDTIRSGAGEVLQQGLQCNAEKYFARLQFTDIPTTNPHTDDFDGDGWSNAEEIVLGGNPLSNDTDGDGYSDDYELSNGGGVANPELSPPPAILFRVQPITLEYTAAFDGLAESWQETLSKQAHTAPPAVTTASREQPLSVAALSSMLDEALPQPAQPQLAYSLAIPEATGALADNLSLDQGTASQPTRAVSLTMEHARVWLEAQPLRPEAVQRNYIRVQDGERTTDPEGPNPLTTPHPRSVMGLEFTIPAGQRYSEPVDLSPGNHAWILAEDENRQVARDRIAKVGLEIWNGQFFHLQAEPEPPPVEKKFEVGAFTVANLNDTDDDGKPDNAADDTEVPDEEDLMRLRVTAGAGLKGKVRLVVKSGAIEFWTEETKTTRIPKNEGKIEFVIPAEGLSKVIWIEATAKSAALRDIEIHADYIDENNTVVESLEKVRATAIWAELGPRGIINTGFEVPAEMDDEKANDTFAENLHSSWGASKAAPPAEQFNFCIGIEFKVFPSGIGGEPAVQFDISRKAIGTFWEREPPPVGWHGNEPDPWPIWDEPNDDSDDRDEDRGPTSDLIYSLDNPTLDEPEAGATRFEVSKRANFREFVRVKFAPDPIVSVNGRVIGSRCSTFVDWHLRGHISRDPQGIWSLTAGKNSVGPGHPDDNIGIAPQ